MNRPTLHPRPDRPKLGELLWRRGACDRDALRRAWELKVIYGDRLGTNLLAESLVDEEALALALGEQHAVHAAYGALLQVRPEARRLLTAPFADRHNVVPHHQDGGRLYLLMTDPLDTVTLDLVHTTTGLEITPVVVCEARMWALLQEHYGISRGMRPIALGGDPFLTAKRGLEEPEEPPPDAALGPELTSEEDFQALYVGRAFGESGAELVEALATEDAPEAPPPPRDASPGAQPFPAAAEPAAAEPAAAELAAAEPAAAEPAAAAQVAGVEVARRMEAIEEGARAQLPTPRGAPEAPTPDEGLTPLSFEDASDRLAGVHNRDEIARVVLRYALTRFRRAALLTVHPHGVFGWEALGDLPRAAVSRFRLPRSEPSVFGVVVESRAHYIGPLQPWTANGRWVKALGRKLPRSVAVFPVFVRGRVVNLLYGDNGHGEHVESDLGELLILAQRIADGFELLLQEQPLTGAG